MLRFVIHPVFVKCRQDLFCGRLASLSQSRLQWGQSVYEVAKDFLKILVVCARLVHGLIRSWDVAYKEFKSDLKIILDTNVLLLLLINIGA